MSEQNPFEQRPQVEAGVSSIIKALVKGLMRQGPKAGKDASRGERAAGAFSELDTALDIIESEVGGAGQFGQIGKRILEAHGRRPGPAGPEARRPDELAPRRQEGAAEQSRQKVEQTQKELEFATQSEGRPPEPVLKRMEETLRDVQGEEAAKRQMDTLRRDIGAQRAERAPGSADALKRPSDAVKGQDGKDFTSRRRKQMEQQMEQIKASGELPPGVKKLLDEYELLPEGPSGDARAKEIEKIARPYLDAVEAGQGRQTAENSIVDDALQVLSRAEERARRAPQMLDRLMRPSAEPQRQAETAMKQRMAEQAITISEPTITSTGQGVMGDALADRIGYLDERGKTQGLGHMWTNPTTGKVRLTILSQGNSPRLHQLPFPDRASALRFIATNAGPTRREIMLEADRLDALKRAQEISMGQTAESILQE